MEHRSLNSAVRANRKNILATYLALAKAAGWAHVRRLSWGTFCTTHRRNSLHNFAMGFDLSRHPDSVESAIKSLVASCIERPTLRLFAMTGDKPENLSALLIQRGFRPHAELSMFVRKTPPAESVLRLESAASTSTRERVAEFMVSQFFSNRPLSARKLVVRSIANSALELMYLEIGERMVAAGMITEVDSCLGLYNLCVHPSQRNQGLGTQVIESLVQLAVGRGKPLVLQCAPDLATWYRARKFVECGKIQAFTLQFENGLL